MNISDKLTQEHLRDIMLRVCEKSRQCEDLQAVDVIYEIKQQIMSIVQPESH